MPVSFAIPVGADARPALQQFMWTFRAFLDEVTASDAILSPRPGPNGEGLEEIEKFIERLVT